ncbi:MAG: NAD(P)-dependent oxidoreductase [Pseudomonadota bacterium]|nr:NAD(P)-dependent oxidoreductase [Pseudomonadota bacterium]
MAAIAFIGLGKMGIGMAGRVLDGGHTLNVYNRTASRADSLVSRGAHLFATPRAACAGADAVISMVADDAASREVWVGPNGILAADHASGALAIECSTLSHDWVIELAAQTRSRGLRYIDAPVTGLPNAAETGKLTLLIGADVGDLRAARGLLEAISERMIHFGAVGTGTAYKLIINMLGAVQIASAAEAMAIAERAGLDPEMVAEAVAMGQAASPQVVRNCRRMVDGKHDQNVVFTPQLRLKDVDYGLLLARKLRIGSPFGALAGAAFRRLCELGHARENESAILEVARSQAPE